MERRIVRCLLDSEQLRVHRRRDRRCSQAIAQQRELTKRVAILKHANDHAMSELLAWWACPSCPTSQQAASLVRVRDQDLRTTQLGDARASSAQ